MVRCLLRCSVMPRNLGERPQPGRCPFLPRPLPAPKPPPRLTCLHPAPLFTCQAFAAAETAYARAMSAVSKLSLCSEADGPSLRAAMQQFSDRPMMMGTSHSSVGDPMLWPKECARALGACMPHW